MILEKKARFSEPAILTCVYLSRRNKEKCKLYCFHSKVMKLKVVKEYMSSVFVVVCHANASVIKAFYFTFTIT